MKIGTLKNHVIKQASLGEYDFLILKIKNSDNVLLQVEKNSKTIIRQRIASYDNAKKIIEATMGNEFPKAFDKDSPSRNVWRKKPHNDGGGLLTHYPMRDENKLKRKKKRKEKRKWEKSIYPEEKVNYYNQGEEIWSKPEQKEDDVPQEYSKTRLDYSRDDESDRDGFLNALDEKGEGSRAPIPKGEDSLDLAHKPQEYNLNYDHSYGTDDMRDYQSRADEKAHSRNTKRKNEESLEDKKWTVLYEDGGITRTTKPLSFNKVLKIQKDHPSAIVQKAEKMKKEKETKS